MGKCLFCNYEKEKYISENKVAVAIYDAFPVNEGHALIIPKRHFSNFFEATEEEVKGLYNLLHKVKMIIDKEYEPTGYNIGINVGEDGG